MRTVNVSAKGFLITLAAEGMAPLVGGCAGALLGGPVGAMAGGVAGKVAEEAVKYFGPGIVSSWLAWLQGQPASVQAEVVAEVGSLTPSEARQAASLALDEMAPAASPEDRAIALEYLAAIPSAVRRSLLTDRARGGLSVPPTLALTNARQLLELLPTSIPPYYPGSDLPGTPYRLGELLGAGGFGAVYKATTPTLQNLSFAIKFCLDSSLLGALKRERANLDRLQSVQATPQGGSERIVRLYGYDFDHATPYLVYEYVPGSDLAAWLTSRCDTAGKGLPAGEALKLVGQVAEALAFAHQQGLVHRDLKPANVLFSGGAVKLTDFGIGSVTAAHAAAHSRIGAMTRDELAPAEQATLFRGAGTALYMSPEQRREAADPRHDLYSLGVLWYQLLVGDVSRELHPGWADELLQEHAAPADHVALIRACVGVMKKRPESASHLLDRLGDRKATPQAASPIPPREIAPPTDKARVLREEVARAVVAVQQAKALTWRFGLWLASLIACSLFGTATVVFFVLMLSLPDPDVRRVFTILFTVYSPLAVATAIPAVLLGKGRLGRRTQARQELVEAIHSAQSGLSLAVIPFDRENDDTLCQAGWGLTREIEERYQLRTTTARVRFGGRWAWDHTIKVYLDGFYLGEGGRWRGFDLTAQLCRGSHLLELRQGAHKCRQSFVVTRDGDCRVEVDSSSAMSLEVEVVGAH